MKIGLIVTSNGRSAELSRLFNSLLEQKTGHKFVVVFCDQGNSKDIIDKFINEFEIIYIKIEKSSLSQARNIGLLALPFVDVVGFPDDDCWYPIDLIEFIGNKFTTELNIDGLCVRVFDPIERKVYGRRPENVEKKINFLNIYRLPISVGIFVRQNSIDQVGKYFNINLGAGTELGSGEETELISRLLEINKTVLYSGFVNVFHPVSAFDESESNKNKYYGFGFGVLGRHLISRKHYLISIPLLLTVLTSLGAFVYYWKYRNKRNAYLSRAIGIIEGIVSHKKI